MPWSEPRVRALSGAWVPPRFGPSKVCALSFRMLLTVPTSSLSREADVKRFADLTEQEILALAITSEDEDSRIYRGFAMGLRDHYPASAQVFDEMAEEEVRHRG